MREDIPFVCTLTFTRGRYSGQRVHIFDEVSLGRDERCDLRLLDAGVSRMHALLSPRVELGAFAIMDLESTNGTRVNDEALDGARLLSARDEVSIGDARAIVSFGHAKYKPAAGKPILLEASIETLRDSQADQAPQAMRFDVSADLLEVVGALTELGATGKLTREDAPPLWLERGEIIIPAPGDNAPDEMNLFAHVSGFEPHALPEEASSWRRLSRSALLRARALAHGDVEPPTIYFPLAGAGEIHDLEAPAPWSIWRVEVRSNADALEDAALTTVDAHTFGEALVRMAWHRWRSDRALWPLRRSADLTFAYEHIDPHLCALETFRGPSAQLALFLRAWLHDLCARHQPGGWPMTHIFATGRFDEEGALRSVRGVERKVARAALFARQHPKARCVMFAPMLDLGASMEDVIARELDEVPTLTSPRPEKGLLLVGLYPEQIGALLDIFEDITLGQDRANEPRA